MANARPTSAAAALAMLATVLLSAGCEVPGLGAAGPAASATPEPDSTDSWIIVARGSATPSPGTGRGVPPSPTPTLPLPVATAAPAGTAPARCAGTTRSGQLNGLSVQPGARSATVTWFNGGDPGLVSYRLAAVPQRLETGNQLPVDWQDVPAGAGCRTMSFTISGLSSGEPYIFWLDAVSRRLVGDGTRDNAVGRSEVVRVR